MPDVIDNDLIVLGAGPGGYAAAFLAADKGKKVTLIDARDKPGGTCLHVGCIPSKALLHAARLITDARDAAHFGVHFGRPDIDLAQLRGQSQKIVDGMARNLASLAKSRKVEVVRGRAAFADGRTVQTEDGPRRHFNHCVIATGSLPAWPASLKLDSPRVMDSSAALALEDVPESLLVVGGGYIGLELGSVYAALGSKVTVVELTDGLLPGVDRELVRPLQARLTSQFEQVLLNTKVARLEDTPEGVRATLEVKDVTEPLRLFDRVLVAVGRVPNSRGLGLDTAGVQVDEKGFIRVDAQRRTTAERIYAVGDVAGEPQLAHKASHEGKVAVEAILGENVVFEPRAIPAVVFTDPEIAWCGLTLTEAKKQGREVKSTRFAWAGSGRAMTLGRTEGLTQLVLDPETDRVLGVGLVGPGAGEMIAEGVLAVEMAASARDLALSIHAHPTLSETIMEAAEYVYGTATHKLPPKR